MVDDPTIPLHPIGQLWPQHREPTIARPLMGNALVFKPRGVHCAQFRATHFAQEHGVTSKPRDGEKA
jgi:hypothetical protein